MSDVFKLPRLYSENKLAIQEAISLPSAQAHYLRSVMRRQDGDMIRLFNPADGEFQATITALGKKSVVVRCDKQLRVPADISQQRRLHLFFAPLPKARMDMLIEKAVELGVTDLHPVITARADVRKINTDRIDSQIIEAAEQCERLTLPRLHDLAKVMDVVTMWGRGEDACPSLQWCCERDYVHRRPLGDVQGRDMAFLIGPAGGFDDQECDALSGFDHIVPISLGENILRAETAALACLSISLLG